MDRERRVVAAFDRDEIRSHQADTAVDQPPRSVLRDARDAVGERRGSLCPTGRPIGEEQHAPNIDREAGRLQLRGADRLQATHVGDEGVADQRVERYAIDRRAAVHEVDRRIDVGPRVGAHGDDREVRDVTVRMSDMRSIATTGSPG